MDTRALLTPLTTRKPCTWDEADTVVFRELSAARQAALLEKTRHQIPDRQRPYDEDLTLEKLVEAIVVHQGQTYYVNTEGFDYARYVVRVVGMPTLESFTNDIG